MAIISVWTALFGWSFARLGAPPRREPLMRSSMSTAPWFLLGGLVVVLLLAWMFGGISVGSSTAMAGGSAVFDGPCTYTTAGRDGFPVFVWHWDGQKAELVGFSHMREYGVGKAVAQWVVGENVE